MSGSAKSRSLRWSASVLLSIGLLFFIYARSVESVNVLVVDGVASPSHQLWMRVLSYALGNHGYNVTVISCRGPSNPPKNLTYINMPELFEFMETDLDFDMLEA